MPKFLAAVAAVSAAACAAMVCAAQPAAAGAGVYDMSGLLAEPYPFAVAPAPPPATDAPRRGGAGRVYDMTPPPNAPHPVDVAAPRPRAAPATSGAAQPAAPAAMSDIAPAAGGEPTFLELGLGYFDINDNEGAAEFRIEWRGRDFWWKLKPMAGVMATSDAAIYGYGGLAADFELGRHVVITPSFAAGAYSDGSGKDLGSAIEFRSAIEVAWRLANGARLGAMLYHISNAGISDRNPGTEVLSLGYSIPLD